MLDGVIAGAAALVAAALAPQALGGCVAGHRSAEPGHSATVGHLGLRPLVDLELRLGEGTGALLALPLVQGAVRVFHEVATFDSAGVSAKRPDRDAARDATPRGPDPARSHDVVRLPYDGGEPTVLVQDAAFPDWSR